MKIKGYFSYDFRPIAPFIEGVLISSKLGLKREVKFLVDTGASVTLLLDKDVKDLGIDINKLKRADKKVSGIGGNVKTYLIEDAKLVFKVKKGLYLVEKFVLHIGIHSFSEFDEETRKRIMMIPSLLGRDLLNRFDLHCLPQREVVYLEKKR